MLVKIKAMWGIHYLYYKSSIIATLTQDHDKILIFLFIKLKQIISFTPNILSQQPITGINKICKTKRKSLISNHETAGTFNYSI